MGDAPPFVGHNAILRWHAIQDAASYMDEDGYEKFWSEFHVSEDFDISLRLHVAGYSLRYASYTGEGFKEGVSLTVYDELARWEKYAYGCNELLFHPFRYWLARGPFTKLFRTFIFSGIPLTKKSTMCTYIGTYYAIAAVWLFSIMNLFITQVVPRFVGGIISTRSLSISRSWSASTRWGTFPLPSCATGWVSSPSSSHVSHPFMPVKTQPALRPLPAHWSARNLDLENLKWVPMYVVFLGGLSLHVSQAILSHFFEIDMAWGATAKEVEDVPFIEEIVRILKRFKCTFFFSFACTGLMVCAWFVFPGQWQIRQLYSIYSGVCMSVMHFGLPMLLNPALMKFTW
jgi:hypothetical protein